RALRRSERRASLQPVNLATLIAGAIDAARPDIDAKGLNLYTTLGIDVGLVTGNPGALQDVVWALLARAVDVSRAGARVEVGVERAGNEVLLRVTDTAGRPFEPLHASSDEFAPEPGGPAELRHELAPLAESPLGPPADAVAPQAAPLDLDTISS